MSDCVWYDFGRTAPTAYGAFCERTMERPKCPCKHYQEERRKYKRRKIDKAF